MDPEHQKILKQKFKKKNLYGIFLYFDYISQIISTIKIIL